MALTWPGAHRGVRRSPEAAFSQVTRITSPLTGGVQRRSWLCHGGEQRSLIEDTTTRAPQRIGDQLGASAGGTQDGLETKAHRWRIASFSFMPCHQGLSTKAMHRQTAALKLL